MSQVPPPRPPASGPSSGTRALMAITALGSVVFLASAAVVGWLVMAEDKGEVAEDSWLSVKLSGSISDAPPQGGLTLEPDDQPLVLSDYVRVIRAAATDERIDGLYLDLDEPGSGWAGFQELRDALVVFRDAGKPCVAYSEGYTTASYYLASACDQVVLAPSGVNMVTGLATSITYYAGTFEKLGVQMEMEHVGDFKSAVEPYERTGPSEPASAAMNAMLDALWSEIVAGMADGRGVEATVVQRWIDEPALSPTAALERGMVDTLAFRDSVKAHLGTVADENWGEVVAAGEIAKTDKVSFTKVKEYLKGLRAKDKRADELVAVIYAEGPIVSGESEGGLFGGSSALADKTFADWLSDARENDDVKAIVLRVNSPGGSGLASDMMWREIRRTQAAGKPVVVSMSNYAASGGYFISAPADWIVAEPMTLTGSIGVFGGKLNLSGIYDKLGMTEYSYERGEEALLFSSSSGFSEGGRAAYRRFLHDFYEIFLGKVSEGRDMERDAVHEVAQGRVWTGSQAIGHGLVDELGGLDVAIAKAEALADIHDAGRRTYPESKGFLELLLEDMAEARSPAVRVELGGFDARALEDLFLLQEVLDDGGVAAFLPWRLPVR